MLDELDFIEQLALRDDWYEIEQVLSEKETKTERDNVRARSGPPLPRALLTQIKASPFLLKQDFNDRLVASLMQILAAGKETKPDCAVIHPVRLKKRKYNDDKYLLIDGLHRWYAYKQRLKRSQQGVWEGPQITEADLVTIPVRVIAIPPHTKPKNFLREAYTLEGRYTIRDAVEALFQEKPGISGSRIANLLNISESSAEKYSRSLRAEWERKLAGYVHERLQEGRRREEIGKLCIMRWPWARGTSPSAIWYKFM
jgi:hypothetical protein